MIHKGLLNGMKRPCFWIGQSLNGCNFTALTFDGQGHAGKNRPAIHDDGTGSTGALVAPDLCSGNFQRFPEGLGKGV